jgi:hypothetical protein
MTLKFAPISAVLALMTITAACTSNTPLQPTPGSGSTNSGSAAATSSTTAGLASPADGAKIPHLSQPVTLTVTNALSTSTAPQTYTFEVATDSAFANIVYSKSGVPAGTGQTSLTIDKVKPATTYYWRARDINGATVGPTTAAKTFAIGPEIILQAPAPVSPAQNGSANGKATLTVANAQTTGPVTQLMYQFDVSDSSSFGNIVFTTKVAEQAGGQTSTPVNATLTGSANYYWRVQVSDAPTGITSPFSSVFSFTFISFDPLKAVFLDNPADLGSWPQTATITSINFTSNAILVEFDRRDGPNRWPDAGFGAGSIEYTLGMCFNLNNQWYCSAAIQFWYGRDLEASGYPSQIALNWYYDARWGAMQGHQPAQGEQIAIFVAEGNERDSGNSYKERSDFVVMPFGGNYTPATGATALRPSLLSRPASLSPLRKR